VQAGEGAGAVRELVFLGFGELGHRAVEAVDDEERIVAEAAGAARRARDLAFADALDDARGAVVRVRIDEGERAAKARPVGAG
jgi:hypothetical protein